MCSFLWDDIVLEFLVATRKMNGFDSSTTARLHKYIIVGSINSIEIMGRGDATVLHQSVSVSRTNSTCCMSPCSLLPHNDKKPVQII